MIMSLSSMKQEERRDGAVALFGLKVKFRV